MIVTTSSKASGSSGSPGSDDEKKTVRVLYLDDHVDYLEIVKVVLGKTGECILDTTPSPGEALDLIRSREYDLILSDYRMAQMSGPEFLIHARAIRPGIPFIFFTGMDPDDLPVVSFPDGPVSYLQKKGEPAIQFAELERKVRNAGRREPR